MSNAHDDLEFVAWEERPNVAGPVYDRIGGAATRDAADLIALRRICGYSDGETHCAIVTNGDAITDECIVMSYHRGHDLVWTKGGGPGTWDSYVRRVSELFPELQERPT